MPSAGFKIPDIIEESSGREEPKKESTYSTTRPLMRARQNASVNAIKKSKSASPAKTQVTASAATGYDESYNLAGPSNPKQDDNQFKRAYMDYYGYQGSYTDVPQKTVKSDKKAQVNTSSKGKKRQRTFDADESTIPVKSFKRYAPEAVAKSLGDVNFENSSDGSKVPIALRCLGFKRIPDIIEESSGPRRSRRLKNKY
ncbi:hypothetical protein JTE90_025534 [Oedothorax gibbosus]|uniref:Uncharacterized protein n=1 Tax=Oedothorax gibbosus TaxID=931172 RepID=A0AAV6TWL1_9ARAC|nr:hypothetical protein JTE90_025534 [Oedothorax gibbosus]